MNRGTVSTQKGALPPLVLSKEYPKKVVFTGQRQAAECCFFFTNCNAILNNRASTHCSFFYLKCETMVEIVASPSVFSYPHLTQFVHCLAAYGLRGNQTICGTLFE